MMELWFLKGTKPVMNSKNLLHKLQDHVHIITDGDIQFTMDIWRPGKVSQTIEAKQIMVVGESKLLYWIWK